MQSIPVGFTANGWHWCGRPARARCGRNRVQRATVRGVGGMPRGLEIRRAEMVAVQEKRRKARAEINI